MRYHLTPARMASIKKSTNERIRWWRSRWMWSTSLSMDTSGTHLKTQNILWNTSWEQARVPDQWKRIYRTTQNSVGQSKEGKKLREWAGLDLHLGGGRTEAGVRSPHRGNCLGQWGSTWGCWRVKQQIHDRLNGLRTTQTILGPAIHTPDRDASPLESAAAGSWSIGTGEQYQGDVCCWLQGDNLRGHEGGDCSGKWLWRKTRQSWRQGDTAESCMGVEPSL